MTDLDHVDVTATEDSVVNSGSTTTKCAYCGCQKDGVLIFHCEHCHGWVHASCLHSGPPSQVLADNYFSFKCSNCSADGKETFERMKLTWIQVVIIALYNLAQTSLGKQGFFKWKEDICVFIDKHWNNFFGKKSRSSQWYCTVGSILSSGNPDRFQSGYGLFKENGWWRLPDPTKAPEYEPGVKPVSTPRPRSAKRSHFSTPTARSNARKRYHASLAQQTAEAKAKLACLRESDEEKVETTTIALYAGEIKHTVKRDSCENPGFRQEVNGKESTGYYNSPASSLRTDSNSMPPSPSSSHSSATSDSKTTTNKKVDPLLPLVAISDVEDDDEDSNDAKKENSGWETPEEGVSSQGIKLACKKNNSLFSCDNDGKRGKVTSPFASTSYVTDPIPVQPKIKMMSLYDEQKLLKKLLSLASTDENLDARRLKRKLLLRQKKRELGLPVLNFDATVRQLRAKEKGLSISKNNQLQDTAVPSFHSTEFRVLDRFMAHDMKFGDLEEDSRTFRQKLVGRDELVETQLIVSPYTQRMLKPFIRRDYESKPKKLKLLEEIVQRRSRSDPSWLKDSHPIDYCYVRARHIPTINAMCSHFFWPGFDFSESLQYPDFSVVALYRKMIIGFGFMVPDVSFNESYITCMLVHPDWRGAGIGTFMLYHLVQTCMGKEITLHVSASNSAMLLYQRFGFKPERFEADFYDKYLPASSKECTHAFFMRLRR